MVCQWRLSHVSRIHVWKLWDLFRWPDITISRPESQVVLARLDYYEREARELHSIVLNRLRGGNAQ